MTIPEKIILDIWEFIVHHYGMACGIVCIFFALHLLWWERCHVFWRAVWHGISAIVRWTLWPVIYLYRKAHTRWKAWKEQRKERHIIAEFDRLHPELKDKYTDHGKRRLMSYEKMFQIFSDLGKRPDSAPKQAQETNAKLPESIRAQIAKRDTPNS